MLKDVVICSAVRTAVGRFGGMYKNVPAVDLGVTTVKEAMSQANIQPEQVDEMILGNVLGAGLGQNVARQVQVHAGVPAEKNAFTINKVCASGLKSVMLAAQAIMCGDSEIVVAGGTENMTQAPYLVKNARWGQRMGDGQFIDSMISDGLMDIFNKYHMGITAENVALFHGRTGGVNGAQPHDRGVHPSPSVAFDGGHDRQAQLLGLFPAGDHHDGGAVVDAAGIARRDRAVFLERGPHLGQGLQGGA